jgi:sulfotransferase
VVAAVLRTTSSADDLSTYISDDQRRRMVRGVVDAYYECCDKPVIFDTNRSWSRLLGVLATLYPGARMICCVRSPAWIMDSTERFIQKDPLKSSRLFGNDPTMTVYDRVQAMLRSSYLGEALNGLRQVFFGQHAERLVVVKYESLVSRPAEVMDALYDAIGEEGFRHDYENVEYEAPEFDSLLGLPGFHTVRRKVEFQPRLTCLPPDLFQQHARCFWEEDQNPNKVTIL